MSQLISAMRKNRLFAATGAIALLLASCSADEPVAQNTTESVINYAVVADNQTRAAESFCNNNKPNNFKVWAIKEDGSFHFEGHDIILQNDVYEDKQTQYWPTEDNSTLSFYAVVDRNTEETNITETSNTRPTITFTNTSSTTPTISYTIEDQVGNQHDLMYAIAADVQRGKTVELNFRHALSQVCFQAKQEFDDAQITIKSISVKKIYSKGTYTLPSTSTTSNITSHTDTREGTVPVTQGSWTYGDNNINTTDDYKIEFNEGVTLSNNAITNLTYNDNTKLKGNWYAKALNLLPQTREDIGDSSPSLELELTITKGNNNSVPRTYNIPIPINWEEGKRYIYTFIFTKDWLDNELGTITYNITVDDFKNDEQPHVVINNHKAVLMRKANGEEESELYFATTNIGANNPSAAGLYFWWGDTMGHEAEGNLFQFKQDNSQITTVNKTGEDLNNFLDNNCILAPKYDAATTQWGKSWRMPTKKDLEWLINEENCEWKTVGNCYKVTSRTTGGTIFLPIVGYIGWDKNQGENESDAQKLHDGMCFYWSSTPPENDSKGISAYRLKIYTDKNDENKVYRSVTHYGYRWDGFPIRPVADGSTSTDGSSQGIQVQGY